jgi:thiamine biosynthesis lipoprotein
MAWPSDDQKKPWLVGLAHPYSDRDTIAKLWLSGQAGVATSSIAKRSWKLHRRPMHHIMDPRTLLPAESDCIQATVIGKELVPAEVYAKCLLILGSREGPQWLAQRRPDWPIFCWIKTGVNMPPRI